MLSFGTESKMFFCPLWCKHSALIFAYAYSRFIIRGIEVAMAEYITLLGQ